MESGKAASNQIVATGIEDPLPHSSGRNTIMSACMHVVMCACHANKMMTILTIHVQKWSYSLCNRMKDNVESIV